MKKMQSFVVAQIFPPFRTLCQRKRKSTATWVQIKGQGMPSELAPKNLRAQEIVYQRVRRHTTDYAPHYTYTKKKKKFL